MRRLLTLSLAILLLSPSFASASIALDSTAGTTVRQSSVGSISTSFTNTAGNILIVGVAPNNDSDVVSGITYNAVALTRAAASTGHGISESDYLYYLISPATGAHTLVITFTTTVTADYGIVSYSGAKTTGQPDGTVSTFVGAGNSSITESITSTADNSWMVAWSGLQRQTTASTNSTIRSGATTVGGSLYDSNGPIHPAGSFSMTQNLSSAGSAGGVAMTIAPAAAASTAIGLPLASAIWW
jgi:hypothetical protein